MARCTICSLSLSAVAISCGLAGTQKARPEPDFLEGKRQDLTPTCLSWKRTSWGDGDPDLPVPCLDRPSPGETKTNQTEANKGKRSWRGNGIHAHIVESDVVLPLVAKK